MSHPNILDNTRAVLVVVDLQDALLKVIFERERVVSNAVRLIEAAKVLSVPTLVTLQYAQKLGDCTQAVADALTHDERFDKMSFSCLGSWEFVEALERTGRRQVILVGVETHVCINQTAHDLLQNGYCVHVVKDAVSSRTAENWSVGIEKMSDSGCLITSTETAIFELVRDASRPEFKQILPLVK